MTGAVDISLAKASAQWQASLAEGIEALDRGEPDAAIPLLSHAVTVSARFHPLYHFLESGLNTELAARLLAEGNFEEAAKYFKRAVFLDHSNMAAMEGKKAAEDGQMDKKISYSLAAMLEGMELGDGSEGTIWGLRNRGRYLDAIELCETTHLAYHKAAAQPWLWRARAFLAKGERMLARNDARRGLDLDRKHPDLLGLSALALDAE